MRVLDLFSGIGGFSLGLERAGMQTVAFAEIDPFCRAVLRKHWPDTPIFRDIKHVTAKSIRGLGPVDLVCGGFPCQPVSVAGARQGEADERWLWPELARVLREVKPRWCLFENVPGLLSADNGRLFGGILRDLAELGFTVEWHVISAADVGAPHLRKRVWIIAHTNSGGRELERERRLLDGIGATLRDDIDGRDSEVADTQHPQRGADPASCGVEGEYSLQPEDGGEGAGWSRGDGEEQAWEARLRYETRGCRGESNPWQSEPNVGRVAHGVPARVDRLRSLGNAVVPQVAEWIGRQIVEVEDAG